MRGGGCAEVPLEALLEDPNLAALEAGGEDSDLLDGMDALELADDPDEPSSAAKSKRKAKVRTHSLQGFITVAPCLSGI